MKSQMMQTMFKFMVALTIVPWILAGCSMDPEKEFTGTEEQRVAKVEGYLLENVATVWQAKNNNNSITWSRVAQKPGASLPGKIADPHYLYISSNSFRNDGDQRYVSFRVPVADVDKWTSILEPQEPPSRESTGLELPVPPREWWVTDDRLSRLTFYDPLRLAGDVNGWVGVDKATGEIFVYSFTM